MNWVIAGIAFWLGETVYFGWNFEPCCRAERICDCIASAIMLIGIIKVIARYEIKKWFEG